MGCRIHILVSSVNIPVLLYSSIYLTSSPAQYPNNRNKVAVLARTESNSEAICQRNSTDFSVSVFSHEGWADKTLLERRSMCDIRLYEAAFYFEKPLSWEEDCTCVCDTTEWCCHFYLFFTFLLKWILLSKLQMQTYRISYRRFCGKNLTHNKGTHCMSLLWT